MAERHRVSETPLPLPLAMQRTSSVSDGRAEATTIRPLERAEIFLLLIRAGTGALPEGPAAVLRTRMSKERGDRRAEQM